MKKSFLEMKEEVARLLDNDDLRKENLNSVEVSFVIACFAHLKQKRFNDEPYLIHPLSVLNLYRRLTCQIKDEKILEKYQIPYLGVEEVCLLHDVIEDSAFSMEDVRNIFVKNHLGDYFTNHIEKPLRLITHEKRQGYEKYIQIVMQDEIASLVKFLDMQDNSLLCTLNGTYSEIDLKRFKKYQHYSKKIDKYYHFTVKFNMLHKLLEFKDFHIESYLN